MLALRALQRTSLLPRAAGAVRVGGCSSQIANPPRGQRQRMKVLITGGSGYLGQFLVQHFAGKGHEVAYTFHSVAAPLVGEGAKGFKVDLRTGEGLDAVAMSQGQVDMVINCAAVSSPGVCEKDPEAARSLNIPSALLKWLGSASPAALLVHISTDQVYDGTKANWVESDECKPVNVYGRSKLDAERAVEGWPNHAILRSSIIYGPEPPVAISRGLFLQWMDGALSKTDAPTTFFEDEYRNPVYVNDICAICEKLGGGASEYPFASRLFNMGGPDRLSRVGMASTFARVRGYGEEGIQSVPAASVDRGVASPPDISMDSSAVALQLGVSMTSFEEGLKAIYSKL